MLFCSQQFLIFFCIIFFVHWALPWHAGRVYLLLGASFYFYASWNRELALLICVSTVMDYLVAHGMDASQSVVWRRSLLVLSLVANLGLLIYFKYANFFLHSLEESLRLAGASVSMPVLQVILPIGISFYTFEAINYTVDVYRRRVPAEKNLFHFMLFITFFPHLIAGPIVRARDFLPQIRNRKRWNWPRLQLGLQLFLLGMIKKLVIADRMPEYVDAVFANPDAYQSAAIWMAVLGYAIQIYCDFSGYTDMALGTAHMLGYKLARNFNMPYLATNIAEFWHRWHISLSTWLRDYLFIPLGGSRGTTWQTCRNLLVTMVLGGLWHGAAWTFVIWGLLHGLLLIAHRFFRDFADNRPTLKSLLDSPPGTILRIACTFLCVCLCWIFFRATTFTGALTIVNHLFQAHDGLSAPLPLDCLAVMAALLVIGHIIGRSGLWKRSAFRVPAPLWGGVYAALATLAMVFAAEVGNVFIYFQF